MIEGDFKNQLDNVLKSFDDFEANVVQKHLTTALHLGAQHFQDSIERNVPVLTGNLRARIEIKKLKGRSQFSVDQDNPITIKGLGNTSFVIGAGISGTVKKGIGRPGYYIVMLERGYYAAKRRTRAKNASDEDKYGRGAKYVPPQPFMQKSFDQAKDKVVSVVVNSLQADVKRQLASGEGLRKP